MAHGRGKTTIDFGPATAPTAQASVVVTGIAGLTAGGQAEAWLRGVATDDHSVDEVVVHGPRLLAVVTGTGEITIRADAGGTGGLDYGEYAVNYVWIDEYDAVDAYYSSPGGAGDYAEASTNVAARVVKPSGAVGGFASLTWSVSAWCRRDDDDIVQINVWTVDDESESGKAQLSCFEPGAGRLALVADEDDGLQTSSPGALFAADWHRLTVINDGAADVLSLVVDGVVVGSTSDLASRTFPISAGAAFAMLVGYGPDNQMDIRNVVVNDRAHTALEEADLYAAGPTHHPLRATGTHWAAGQSIPIIWCTPAAAGRVANSGSGGVCDLVLNGSVTSEEDA